MNFTQISHFITLARCLNFTEAAKQLYIAQSALSRKISALEDELGFKLFVRTNKATALTQAGKCMLKGFEHIMEDFEDTLREARQLDRYSTNRLIVGVLEMQSTNYGLYNVISMFSEDHKGFSVEVTVLGYRELRSGLQNGDLDIAITAGFELSTLTGVCSKPLCVLDNYLVVPSDHPGATLESPTLSDFSDLPFLCLNDSESPALDSLISETFKATAANMERKRFPKYRDLLMALESGQGVFGLNSSSLLSNSGSLRFIKVPEIENGVLVAAYSSRNTNPAIPLFMELIP